MKKHWTVLTACVVVALNLASPLATRAMEEKGACYVNAEDRKVHSQALLDCVVQERKHSDENWRDLKRLSDLANPEGQEVKPEGREFKLPVNGFRKGGEGVLLRVGVPTVKPEDMGKVAVWLCARYMLAEFLAGSVDDLVSKTKNYELVGLLGDWKHEIPFGLLFTLTDETKGTLCIESYTIDKAPADISQISFWKLYMEGHHPNPSMAYTKASSRLSNESGCLQNTCIRLGAVNLGSGQ